MRTIVYPKKKRVKRDYALELYPLFKANGISIPDPEYRFCPTRRWRFDFAWTKLMIAMEIEGGLWIQGRHNRAAGMIKDAEKYNSATVMGWRVLRYTPQNMANIIADIKEILKGGI